MASAPLLRRTDSARGDFSPLKHFVVAKKTISDVFEQLLDYVRESSAFVEGKRTFFSPFFLLSVVGQLFPRKCQSRQHLIVFVGQKPMGIKLWRTLQARTKRQRFRRMPRSWLSFRRCCHADTWRWPFLAGKSMLSGVDTLIECPVWMHLVFNTCLMPVSE